MKIRFFTAQALVKIGFCFGKAIGKKKSERLGKLALKICPNALEQISCTGSTVFVTGSDRSSCADTIFNILKFSGKNTHAFLGSNNINEVAGELLKRCRPLGKIKRDILLIEAEDSSAADILHSLSPDYAVISNLLHTTPERNGLPEMIKEKIEKSVTKNTVLVLNANDPLLAGLSVSTKKVFFAVDDENCIENGEPVFGIRCPCCGSALEYSKVYTSHIGNYKCVNISCNFSAPETIYTAANIDNEKKRMQVMGYGVGVQIKGELTYYRVSSICAAITLCNILGIEMKHATSHASAIRHFEEFDSIKFGDRKVKLITVRQDSANLEKAIASITQTSEKKSIIFYLNNKDIDKNISWLYDADISRINKKNISIIVCGNRAFDLAVRLKLEGFEKNNLKIIDDIQNIKKHINILHDEVSLLCFIDGSIKDKQKLISRMHAELITHS